MVEDIIQPVCLDTCDGCEFMETQGIGSVFSIKFMILVSFLTFFVDFFIMRGIVPVKSLWASIRSAESRRAGTQTAEDIAPEEIDEKETFISQYFEELDELEEDELNEVDKLYISESILRENTPDGDVVMTYNFKSETFDYYTDRNGYISYDTLDTLARLFAIRFKCKILCVNYRKEFEKGEKQMQRDIEQDKQAEMEANNSAQPPQKNNLFVAYKHYNRKLGSGGVGKKYCVMTENSNKFKYRGKLEEYETNKEKEKEQEKERMLPNINISYNEYKEMCKKEL